MIGLMNMRMFHSHVGWPRHAKAMLWASVVSAIHGLACGPSIFRSPEAMHSPKPRPTCMAVEVVAMFWVWEWYGFELHLPRESISCDSYSYSTVNIHWLDMAGWFMVAPVKKDQSAVGLQITRNDLNWCWELLRYAEGIHRPHNLATCCDMIQRAHGPESQQRGLPFPCTKTFHDKLVTCDLCSRYEGAASSWSLALASRSRWIWTLAYIVWVAEDAQLPSNQELGELLVPFLKLFAARKYQPCSGWNG